MAHSDGHITSPVSFADVNATLGTRHTDLFALCTDDNVNMWSAYKPIYSEKVGILTDADFSGQGHVVSGYKTGGGIKKQVKTGSAYKSDITTDGVPNPSVSPVWAWDKPQNDGICAARLHDYNNYYHNAARIFRITTIFGNINNIMFPSGDSVAGSNIAFAMSFVSGQMTPAKLFGDCWSNFYPAVILTNGGTDKIHYVKSAPNPISSYTGSSGVTININTRDFADQTMTDWRASHSTNPYDAYPFRTGNKWTACIVLVSRTFGGSAGSDHKLGDSDNIVRLEYASPSGDSHVDRRTLPIKQSKYNNIEWMKMKVVANFVENSGTNAVWTISSITVTAKMLSTSSITFSIDAIGLGTPQGTVNVEGSGSSTSGGTLDVTGYSSVTFSGTTGEVTKTLTFNTTKYYIPQSATTGNKLCNGTLRFNNSAGNFTGTFSIDITTPPQESEVQLL